MSDNLNPKDRNKNVYPENLNPFQSALNKLSEYENLKQSDKGFSFTNVIISKIFNDRLKQSEQEAIIKLAIKSADFDEQHDRKTVEICNKVQKEVKPQIYSKIWKIGIIDRNETVKCTENKSSETISWVDRIKSNET